MTIKEMIVELQKYDQNLEIGFGWDGGITGISIEDFEVDEEHKLLKVDVSCFGSISPNFETE